MTFAELAHDIEARTREKLTEGDKNRFAVGPEQPTGDIDERTFALGSKTAQLAHADGKIYLKLGHAPSTTPADGEGHAVNATSIEPLSEKLYEYLAG